MNIVKLISRKLLIFISVIVFLGGCSPGEMTYQVNDVVSDPGVFRGTLNIIGVVNAYSSADSSIFGIMDRSELQCTTPNCNKRLLAVRYDGELPAIGDEIRITGSIVNGNIFQVEALQVVANHKIGGQG